MFRIFNTQISFVSIELTTLFDPFKKSNKFSACLKNYYKNLINTHGHPRTGTNSDTTLKSGVNAGLLSNF